MTTGSPSSVSQRSFYGERPYADALFKNQSFSEKITSDTPIP